MWTRTQLWAPLLACFLLSSSQISASNNEASEDEMLFGEIPSVYSASKRDQKVTEAPASVTLITSDEIQKFGYRTLADVLNSVRGFYTTYDRNYHYVGVRGFGRPGDYNTRILVLVDGHRINDAVYDSSSIGHEFHLNLDLVDRIEIIRGPASSLYGTSAFFGVINVITKRGRHLEGTEISTEAASFDTFAGRASYGNRFSNGLEMVVSGSVYDSAGQDLFFPEFEETNGGFTSSTDYDRSRRFFSRVLYGDFSFHGFHVSRKKGVPTAPWETVFNDSRTFAIDQQTQLGLDHEYSFQNGLELTSRFSYNRTTYEGGYVFDYSDEGDGSYLVVNRDDMAGERIGAEVKAGKSLGQSHYLTLGTEYRNNFRLDQSNYDEEVYLDDRRDSQIWGLYLQDEFLIHPRLILNAGFRYDYYSFETTHSRVSPRLAFVYNPTERTTLKLLYGESFRAPTAYELFYHDGWWTTKPALSLDPETIRTAELVVDQQVGEHLWLTGSVFRSTLENLISLRTDPEDELLLMDNLDAARADGIELGLEAKWENGLQSRLSYSFQQAYDEATDQLMSNAPKHLAKFNLIVPLYPSKVFAGFEGQFMGNRHTLGESQTNSFFITNLTLFSQDLISGGWKLSATLWNLFDQQYYDPASEEHLQDRILQDGRNFRIKLSYLFGDR